MKKNKALILIGNLCVVALIAIFCLENNVFEDGTLPYEKGENNQTEENVNNLHKKSSEMIEEENREKSNILYTSNVSIEILSCEMIEDIDIESQTTYKSEWFKMGELPDAEYVEEYIDYETIKEVCPELRDLWEKDNYTMNEKKEIYDRNMDVIEEYTTMRHPKTRYFFVTCRITNLSGKINEVCLDLDTFISSDKSEYLAMQECTVYFDKAIYTTGADREKRFFWYTFGEDEVLECTLGYEVKEEWDEYEEYYIGVQTPGVDYWTLENTQLVPLVETGDANE